MLHLVLFSALYSWARLLDQAIKQLIRSCPTSGVFQCLQQWVQAQPTFERVQVRSPSPRRRKPVKPNRHRRDQGMRASPCRSCKWQDSHRTVHRYFAPLRRPCAAARRAAPTIPPLAQSPDPVSPPQTMEEWAPTPVEWPSSVIDRLLAELVSRYRVQQPGGTSRW